MSVRGGGHNVAGSAVCDGGLMIDLSRMKSIEVDPERRIARAEAGLNLGEFDAATQAFGLATTMGVNSDTGIAGLTLGGGFGKLGRKYGLACDNLLAADVVTADGRLLTRERDRESRSVLGHSRRRRQFRRRHGVRIPAPSRSVRQCWPAPCSMITAQARDALRFYYEFSSTAPDELSADAALMTTLLRRAALRHLRLLQRRAR